MDGWGIAILVVGLLGYYISKRRAEWLFVAGVGTGLLAGAIWAGIIIGNAFSGLR